MNGPAEDRSIGLQPPFAALDPGRSKCGLVRCDPSGRRLLAAGILDPVTCWQLLQRWTADGLITAVLLGDGTGSGPWKERLSRLPLALLLVPEAGTTLAARQRYWQLEPPRGWRRLLPQGLRLPPRDVDDVVAQLLLERHLGRSLERTGSEWLQRLRTSPVP
ncbi:MAG: resolvase [Cyanobium sp.]